MYDVCTELSACIFGKDMFVDLIVIDTICRFLRCPGYLWKTEQWTLGCMSPSSMGTWTICNLNLNQTES